MTTELVDDFDPTDPRVVRDPYPIYAAMRAECPVGHGSRFGGFHVLSRFADVDRAAHNPTVFSSAQGVTVPDFGNPMTAIPLEIDPPEHAVAPPHAGLVLAGRGAGARARHPGDREPPDRRLRRTGPR